LLARYESGSGFFASFLDQAGNCRGQLSANALPMSQAILCNAETFVIASGDRVVETEALDETAIATVTGIGSNDVEEGALLGTGAGKTDNDHNLFCFQKLFEGGKSREL
jgi:hypothetical protein